MDVRDDAGCASENERKIDMADQVTGPTIPIEMSDEQVERVYNWLDGMVRQIGIYARRSPEPWAISLHDRLGARRAAATVTTTTTDRT